MIKAGINGKEAFFVMSSEEGEGSLIGYRGSIDKDSGVTGLALAVLAAEQLGRGMTLHEYLMETYDRYGYSKAYLEPMVMTGEYGMTMINDNIMGYLRNTLLPAVCAGQRCEWQLPGSEDTLVLTGGFDHLDLMKKPAVENPDSWTTTKRNLPDDPAQWPIAIRESINILEFYGELASERRLPKEQRIRIMIVMRPSGTEPKHKNMVKVIAPPRDPERETLRRYIGRIDKLSRAVLDAAMITSYDASLVEYDSKVAEEPGKMSFAALSPDDRLELLRLFPIIVSTEAKLAIYFPLRAYIRKEAARLRTLGGRDFHAAYKLVRENIWGAAPDGSTKGYLTHFNKTNGIEFIEESVRMSLFGQLTVLSSDDPKVGEVYVQALLWFGPELGRVVFVTLLKDRVLMDLGTLDRDDPAVQAEVDKVMGELADSFGPKAGIDRP